MTGYDKIVKGATKIKAAAPKTKYLDPLVRSTSDKTAFREVISYLDKRLGDSAWTIVYKSLIVIHTMIKEGEKDVVLKYLGNHPDFLEVSQMKKMHDTNSLVPYAKYLTTRGKEFQNVKLDYIRDYQISELNRQDSRLKSLTVEKGLLREVESVLKQIKVLVSTRFTESNITNDITLTSFRLTITDLLILFNVLNVGVINILEHFFEMSRYDAERALEIYREYCLLTGRVVEYLKIAKHMEYATKVNIPTLKHAPVSLVEHLEDYLQNGGPEGDKGGAKNVQSNAASASDELSKQQQQYQQQLKQQQQQLPQLQPIAVQPTTNPFFQQVQQAATAAVPMPIQPQLTNNPFLQQQVIPLQLAPQQPQLQAYPTGQFSSVQASAALTPAFTGAGFGGYTPQQQQQQKPVLQHTATSVGFGNAPSLQSPSTFAGSSSAASATQPQPLRSSQTGNNPFSSTFNESTTHTLTAIQEQPTNNPFSVQNNTPSTTSNPQKLLQQQTNPFALSSSANPNAATVQRQPTMGGYENLQTTPVFPSTIQEQRTGAYVQGAMNGLGNQVQAQQLQQQFTAQQQQFTQNPYLQQQQQQVGISNGYIQQPQYQANPYGNGHVSNNNNGFYDGPSLI
ncbi:hypothetical protein WICPIJ_001347 [Wickerhamomyces pijperi]|uniref:ENTH domain-containing protein n=1 Tax=Wickerhamomyces pijperi TaxID=599730 RepID=A0A9P8QAY3_WICPI|nr:hypothetical protein WICPIJ_001347 [Wickerhamomyces pijperi]